MRILSYNIHGWRTLGDRMNLGLLVELLKSTEADIIGLNEVYHPVAMETSTALSFLAEQLGMYVAFAAKRPWQSPGDIAMGASGNALLSRYPFLSTVSGLFSSIPGKKQRGFLEGRIAWRSGQTYSIVVTHFDPTDEQTRQAQFAELLEWFEQTGSRPDMILGDFNCINPREYEHHPKAYAALSNLPEVAKHLVNSPEGPQLARKIEQAGYIDVLAQNGSGRCGTFIPAQIPVRLDYIWLRSDRLPHLSWTTIIEEPSGQEASDHRPVLAELTTTEVSTIG
ncbi:hypothetical protein TUMEXPCC7403_14660 [Tumidithrix helvetica PCC 7403]|uniref:endonuclease/exonuclease/phosphatase family protein n=1 Tax=Tumidithrix helvetica TaxID=3457545 RepID=UPI003C88BEA8